MLQVRLLAIAGAVAIASRGTALLKPQSVAFVHLIAFGLWLGSNAWTTFFAGITMFKNLPRQTFGRLQVRFQVPGLTAERQTLLEYICLPAVK